MDIPTATRLRKAVATEAAKKLDSPGVRLLSRQMSHSVETHRKSYEQLKTAVGAAQAHKLVGGLVGKPPLQRRGYTHREEIEIGCYFAENIANKKSIKLQEARDFLKINPLIKRSAKQIQDKVAATIKRNIEDGV